MLAINEILYSRQLFVQVDQIRSAQLSSLLQIGAKATELYLITDQSVNQSVNQSVILMITDFPVN